MPDALINRTPAGWPYLDEDNYLDAIDDYTVELATKLDNADADVAAAVNAASKIALSGWTTIATGFASGITGQVKLRTWGYLVEIDIAVTSAGFAQGNTTLGAAGFIPANFRPSSGQIVRFPGYNSGGYLSMFWVSSSGELGVTHRNASAMTAVQGRSACWLRNA